MTPQEISRANRLSARGRAKVTHPKYGAVIVPHLSKLAAIENAAEVWGCNYMSIISDVVVFWMPSEGSK